jgi:thermitase
MRWTFSVGDRTTTLTRLAGVVAVRPVSIPPTRAEWRRLLRTFGRPVAHDCDADHYGLALPARDGRRFERAGWGFVDPNPAVADAVSRGETVPGARALRPAYLDAHGRLFVGTDLVVVQVPPGLAGRAAGRWLAEDGLTPLRRLRFAPETFEARLPAGRSLEETIRRLQEGGRYRVVEPELLEVIRGRQAPNDPGFADQWQHVAIHSEEAWLVTRGRRQNGRPVRVAVIDHGMQIGHPDLAAGIVGGGYFVPDGVGGADFTPFQAGDPNFPNSKHGTFCLGMAGARRNNNLDGCGSAPECDLLAFACLPDEVGTQATLARAVAQAADPRCEGGRGKGADVISCSLGGSGAFWQLTWALEQAIDYATGAGRRGRGTAIFWAVADNAAALVSQDEVCSHPAVIAVGQSDSNDQERGSAYGAELDFLAPGVEVYSTQWGGAFGAATGTSYAAPLAAGVAALVLARYPSWTLHHVRRRLRHSCDPVGGVAYLHGRNDHYGNGRINAARAVR